MSLIGIHIDDIFEIQNKKYSEIKYFQIMGSTPQKNKKSNSELNQLIKYVKMNKIFITIHASYTINLSKRWTKIDPWILQFISEIETANELNCSNIVIHTGKQLDLSIAEAINNMYTSLIHIHQKTIQQKNVRILLETPAGQGTETLIKIEEFCRFMNKFYKHPDQVIKNRFGICIDTCHIFASGHDIRQKQNVNKFFKVVEETIGIDKIKLAHINDSKGEFNSRLDRHMSIGYGNIGLEPIQYIVKFMKSLGIPMILETPSDKITSDLLVLTPE